MTDKETFQQQKVAKVTELYDQQKALVMQSVALHKSNPNLAEVLPGILANSLKIRLIEAQKQMIISQPFPKFERGASAVINETGPELINVTPILSLIFQKEDI